jgi:hypothetical protein
MKGLAWAQLPAQHTWGAGASWVSLGGPVGGLAAGIGGCLQEAVGMVCGCWLGGSARQVSGVVQFAMGQVGGVLCVGCLSQMGAAISHNMAGWGGVVLCW